MKQIEIVQFKNACLSGDLNQVNKIIADVSPEALQKLLRVNDYLPFRLAYDSNNKKLTERLLALVSIENKPLMLAANNNLVFKMAIARNDEPFIYFLLGCPDVFTLADESQVSNFYLLRYIKNILDQPNAPHHAPNFENSEEAMLYFCFLKHLIRLNNPKYQKYFDLIIEIPAIRDFIIWDETKYKTQELSSLARKTGNTTAVKALYQIYTPNAPTSPSLPSYVSYIGEQATYVMSAPSRLLTRFGIFTKDEDEEKQLEGRRPPSISSY